MNKKVAKIGKLCHSHNNISNYFFADFVNISEKSLRKFYFNLHSCDINISNSMDSIKSFL